MKSPTLLLTSKVFIDKHGQKTDALESQYTKYFAELGYETRTISNFLDLEKNGIPSWVEEVACLVLTGGNDPDPRFVEDYKQENWNFSNDRSATENILIEYFVENNKPILGLCYGFQVLNTYFNGRITAFTNKSRTPGIDHSVSSVQCEYFDGRDFEVNHYHNHSVKADQLGNGLIPLAIDSQNNTIESFKHDSYQILAIQWHPERKNKIEIINKTLIKRFIKE